MRKLILIMTAAVLLVSLNGCAFNADYRSQDESVSTRAYSAEEVFEVMSEALAEFNGHTEYEGNVSQDVIDDAVEMVKHFYPDYFWLNGYTTLTTGSSSTSVTFMTLDDCNEDELGTMHDKLIKTADDIIAQIPPRSTDFEKALFVHDYIVNNTRYATEKRGLNYNGLWGTAYGCLVDGSAVCQGYAEAYSLIMQRLGIECGVCSGQSDRGSHAWNYIKTDGAYYWVDTTWDDPEAESESSSDKLRHNYFMMNDELMLRTRSLGEDQYFVPKCTSMDRNYFVMTNAYLHGYFPEEVGKVLAENADEGLAEIMFADETSFKSALDGLFENQEIWELSGYTELGYSLNYSYDDKMYVLRITY